MRTLLVGLDNHRKEPAHRALWPLPDQSVGAVLMRLINEHVDEKYRPGAFVLDFARANMYPMRRAPNGKGKTQADTDAITHMMYTAGMIGVNDVVLIGGRVRQAFNRAYGEDIDWMQSRTVSNGGEVRRVWAIPYPDTRFVQYREHRAAIGNLLAMLRNRTMIPYGEKVTERAVL